MKRAWALRLARAYARRAMGRAFEGVVVDGLDNVRAAAARGPIVLCPNHLSWWDAFVAVVVDEALGTDGRCLMGEANLQRLPFFDALGAVPLSLTDPRRALSQLSSTAALLQKPGDALWIFPQGRQTPSWRRPLGFQRGFVRVVEPSGAAVVPVSVVLLFRERKEPLLAVRLHTPRDFSGDARHFCTDVESVVGAGIDALDAEIAAGVLPPVLVHGTGGNASVEQGLGARLLTRFAGARP